MELKDIIEKEVKKESDDFLHCEAFKWCKGKNEIEEEHEENLKQFAIFYGIVFVVMIIIMVILNKTMGIVWN